MRRFKAIWILFIASLLAGCGFYPRESEMMATAMEQAEAVYGDGSLLVETDTALFIPCLAEASDYYAGKKQYGKAALAALYNGYTERGVDDEAAMVSFKKAECFGDLAHDSLTMARAEYWMGKMYYREYLHADAMLLLRNASELFGKHYAEKALAINAVACCLIVIGEQDSALTCLEQSLHYADLAQSDIASTKTLNNLAVLFGIKKDYSRAVECLKLVKPVNTGQEALNCLNLAGTYDIAGIRDSAIKYYKDLELMLESSEVGNETKTSGYAELSNFTERNGDLNSALDYRKKYERLLEKTMNQIAQKNIYRIQQKYDYETLQNNTHQKIANKQRIIIIAFVLLSLMTIAFGLLQRRLALKTKQEAETRKRVLYYIQRYYDTLSKHGETMRKVAIVSEHRGDKAILDDLIKTVFGKKEPWDAFMEIFDTLYHEENEKMQKTHPDLTELERKSFILSYFNVSRQDEALLLKINIHSVDKLRQSVKKKTTNKGVFSEECL